MPTPEPDARLVAIEDELYGVPPGEFVARRTAAAHDAKARGDRELAAAITALRKPTAAAWALDAFARADAATIGQLLELGERLRRAIADGDGDAIRARMRERGQAVTGALREIRRHAAEHGTPLSGAVATQVEQTLRAALTSAAAGELLRRGVLSTALDESDLAGLTAAVGDRATRADRPPAANGGVGVEPTRRRAAPSTGDRRRRAELERQVADAERLVERAERELDDSGRARRERESERDDLRRRLDEVERLVREDRDREAALTRQVREARAELRAVTAELRRDDADAR